MQVKEIKEISKKMLATFINEIGLNGEYYASINKTPIAWGNPKLNSPGEFVSPESKRLNNLLNRGNYDEKIQKKLKEQGVILLNKNYRQREPDADLFITLIHEELHANRNLLVNDIFVEDNGKFENQENDDKSKDEDNFIEFENDMAYSYDGQKVVPNMTENTLHYADASQEIFKGNIDNSEKAIEQVMSEGKEYDGSHIDDKMAKQIAIDEALVEIMAFLSYELYANKEKGNKVNIWDSIEKAKTVYAENSDISYMCDIILKHHDFELFNWMIDPIGYSAGDIHYDFFGEYTKEDKDLLEKFYIADGEQEKEFVRYVTPIDMKEVATSREGMQQLSGTLNDIKKGTQGLSEERN